MLSGLCPPDPFVFIPSPLGDAYLDARSLTPRAVAINPAQKALVLIVAGQSVMTNVVPTAYVPTNSSVIGMLNINDGAFYPVSGPVLSCSYTPSLGPGNIAPRVADLLVTNGKFNQVFIVDIAQAGCTIAQWNSTFSLKTLLAMRRLAARGLVPSAAGVQFGYLWGQGEAETLISTSQASYAASLATLKSDLLSYGFLGKMFINKETMNLGNVWAPVQAAQVAFVDNATVFAGADMDSIPTSQRQPSPDFTHPLDTGAASAATLIYNAMVASGY